MSGSEPGSVGGSAVVFGGGGSAGNAWLIGVAAGLAEAGADAAAADTVIGTSAGATAAAQVTGGDPARLLADILDAPARAARPGAPGRAALGPDAAARQLERMDGMIAASKDAADYRRRLGTAALEASTAAPDWSAAWRETVAARLPSKEWPERRLLITAVDAETGEAVILDRDSGIDLVDAVAASCAGGGRAYRIGDRWYLDGGYRSNADNADLASGHERALVLSPFGGRSLLPEAWGLRLDGQLERLSAEGTAVETIFPDDAARSAFGDNMMSPSARRPAARAGRAQGRAAGERLAGFISGRGPR